MTVELDKYEMHVVVPWPEKALWPNRKAHWSTAHKARQRTKEAGFYLAKEHIGVRLEHVGEEWCSEWEAYDGMYFVMRLIKPPDGKKRDEDNIVAALKGYQDGIFQAMGIDDSRVKVSINVMCNPHGLGLVEYFVSPLDPHRITNAYKYMDFMEGV